MGKNEELNLPFGKMEKIIVAFDVDGTLIDEKGEPYSKWHDTLRTLSTCKNIRIVVWSGGGKKYAESIGMRFDLDKYVWRYASKLEWADLRRLCGALIAIDDIQDTAIGDVNLIVRNK